MAPLVIKITTAFDGRLTIFDFCRRVKKPAFRMEVVDCSGSGGPGVGPTDAFVVLENFSSSRPLSTVVDGGGKDDDDGNYVIARPGSASGGNRWVKRRQRKMGTARFFDETRARRPPVSGKTIE